MYNPNIRHNELKYKLTNRYMNLEMLFHLVLFKCDTLRNDSATPDVATSASASAVVQPEDASKSPSVFHRAISR